MKTGHTPSRTVDAYWEDTTIPWFTLADVWQLRDGSRTYLGETANRISELGLANSAAELLPTGTVVLSRTASVGFTGIMPVPMATSQDFWNWVCGPSLLPEYLIYVFRAMHDHFRSLMIGSTHKTIYQAVAAAIRIPLPPLDEQRRIVAQLDEQTAKIDNLIAKAERFIVLAKERRAALITAAVTGQLDVTFA
jgi:type I restriction enzyme S subunit